MARCLVPYGYLKYINTGNMGLYMDQLIKESFDRSFDTMGWSLVGVTPEIKEKFFSLIESHLPPEVVSEISALADNSGLTLAERSSMLHLDTSTLYNYLRKCSSVSVVKHDFVKVTEPVAGKNVIVIFKTSKPISLYLENNLLGVLASRLIVNAEDTEYEYCGRTSEKDEMILLVFE